MLPDRVSNPGPLTYESGALPIALRGSADNHVKLKTIFFLATRSLKIPCPVRNNYRNQWVELQNKKFVFGKLFKWLCGIPA